MRRDYRTGLVAGTMISTIIIAAFVNVSTRSSGVDKTSRASFNSESQSIRMQDPSKAYMPKMLDTQNSSAPRDMQEMKSGDTATKAGKQDQVINRFHIVQEGETLSAISKKYYGRTGKWREILDANPKTIRSASDLKPGMSLIIP